jgi:hypothetical protein
MSLEHYYAKLFASIKPQPLCFTPPNTCLMLWYFGKNQFFMTTESGARSIIAALISLDLYSISSHDEGLVEIWSITDTCLLIAHDSIDRGSITSPGQAHTENFSAVLKPWMKHTSPLRLVLPPSNWDEIQQIRIANFPGSEGVSYPLATIKKRFEIWDGVPRTLFLKKILT